MAESAQRISKADRLNERDAEFELRTCLSEYFTGHREHRSRSGGISPVTVSLGECVLGVVDDVGLATL